MTVDHHDSVTPAWAPIIVVSGLPRSGTSLMMQILTAAEIPLLTDGNRDADDSNPRGYFEFDPVKNLAADQSWVSSACGKGVKIILQLLPHLPGEVGLDVIMMDRPISEVVASQNTMLKRMGLESKADPQVLASVFERQRQEAIEFLERRQRTRWIEISHPKLLSDTLSEIGRIRDFLKIDPSREPAMLNCVEPSLHRTKA